MNEWRASSAANIEARITSVSLLRLEEDRTKTLLYHRGFKFIASCYLNGGNLAPARVT
jgi:hypothetical protein